MPTNRTILAVADALLPALPAFAQQPRLENVQLEERAAAGGLARSFRALVDATAAPAWIGYAVPMVAGEHSMCCYSSDNCCGGCRLESGSSTTGARAGD